jgi:hypothetical protein
MTSQDTGILKTIGGIGLVVVGALTSEFNPASGYMISAGIGLAASGIGTLIAGDRKPGTGSAIRNPIKTWDVLYGQGKLGGTLVYIYNWGHNNQMLDMVFVLCAHPVLSVDTMLFNQAVVSIDPTAVTPNLLPNTWPAIGGTSYSPAQTRIQLASGDSITRANDVVTVVSSHYDIPAIQVGFPIRIYQVEGPGGSIADEYTSLNGNFIVATLSRVSGVSITFTVLNGGQPVTVTPGVSGATGWIGTQWSLFGRNVYVEYMLGNQTLGQTFAGMVSGTPWQGAEAGPGDGTLLVSPQYPENAGNSPGQSSGSPNPWTNYASMQGKTAAFVRLTYDANIFAGGIPQVSFLVRGKNNIYDPRLGALTGLKSVTLQSAGAGGYSFGDVLTLGGGSGGTMTLTGVDGLGNPTSWAVTDTGYGYSLGVASSSGGSGSGATFNVTVLGGIASGVSTISIVNGGSGYAQFEELSLDGGALGRFEIEGVNSSGAVVGVRLTYPGYGYQTGITTTSGNNGGTQHGFGCTIKITELTGPASSAVYSNNAALCIADYLADPTWGCAAPYLTPGGSVQPYKNIDVTALTVSADVCDQPVNLAAGGTEPKYQCDGRFDLSLRRGEILQNLLTSCAGRFLYTGGLYSFQPGYWAPIGFPSGSPVVAGYTIPQINVLQMAAGPVRWNGIGTRDLYNAVKGTYISAANKYQPSDFPYYAQDTLHGYAGPSQYGGDINLALDLGQRRYLDIHLPFTLSSSAAQRIAKIELLRRRNQGAYGVWSGTLTLNMAGYQFVPLDVIAATFPPLAWSNEVLEVRAVRFRADAQKNNALVLYTEIDVQQSNANIYPWDITEELSPQGYAQAVLPGYGVNQAVPFPWSPGGIAPLSGDALYTAGTAGQGNFGILPVYVADGDGGFSSADIQITGVPVINALDDELDGAYITAMPSAVGGSVPAGQYAIGLSAFNADSGPYANTSYRDLVIVDVPGGVGVGVAPPPAIVSAGINYRLGDQIYLVGGSQNAFVVVTGITGTSVGPITSISVGDPGYGYSLGIVNGIGGSGSGAQFNIASLTSATDTGSIELTIQWGSGTDSGDLYMALQSLSAPQVATLVDQGQQLAQNQMHYQQTVTGGATTATITSFNASTPGGPDTVFNKFGIVWQQVVHSGPWAEQIQAVTGTYLESPGTVTVYSPSTMTTNQWAGYTLTLLAHYDPAVPIQILNMPISASSAVGSGGGNMVLTIGQNSVGGQLPSLTSLLAIGDLVGPLYDATFTASSYTDPSIANGYYPTGDTGIEAGHLAVMMTGVDAGDVQPIASVSGTNNITVNLLGTWQQQPNDGDVVIVVKPATAAEWKTPSYQTPNKTGGVVTIAVPNMQNLSNQVWLFTVRTLDINGNTAPDFCHPKQMIYLFGAGGTRLITAGTSTMNAWDSNIEADCSGGNVVYNCLLFSSIPNQEFTVSKNDSSANTVTVNTYSGDTFLDGSTSWTGSIQGASFTFRVNA